MTDLCDGNKRYHRYADTKTPQKRFVTLQQPQKPFRVQVCQWKGRVFRDACYIDRKQEEEDWGILLTPVVEKNELVGSLEPSNRSSVSNYRHTHPGQDRQKPKAPKPAGKSHQDRETYRPSDRGGQGKDRKTVQRTQIVENQQKDKRQRGKMIGITQLGSVGVSISYFVNQPKTKGRQGESINSAIKKQRQPLSKRKPYKKGKCEGSAGGGFQGARTCNPNLT